MKTQKQRMINSKLYMGDEELRQDMYEARCKMQDFNKSITAEEIREKAKNIFGEFGKDSMVTPPFRFDYGYNIFIGEHSYLNFNVSILDCAPVYIGDNVLIGPDCAFLTPNHPKDPEIRRTFIEYAEPIKIENDVWIGGKVTVIGGVTIGEGSIIGAGSVVVKDIPKGVIAAGNPCKVIRKIDENDKQVWQEKYDDYQKEMGEE
ncbi:sugar O-acetyltransferase [Anaerococcus sp. mt242]|uniref:sugar O-acetyltransferase n=1 Tax=unclassified Anaerococcus TaxID=2614126 RepID=UPI001932BA5B|nr:sugar O-acetyltransferase [Anaerococcus sp. mt242]MBM0046158.1 sugar O-acetyltransferase [Anaerococcus sp. mt242]